LKKENIDNKDKTIESGILKVLFEQGFIDFTELQKAKQILEKGLFNHEVPISC